MSDVYGESENPNGHDGREYEGGGSSGGELPRLEDLSQRARQWEGALRYFARVHPVPLLLGAAAAGYLLARLVRGGGR